MIPTRDQIEDALERHDECCHVGSPRNIISIRDCLIPTVVAAEVVLALIEERPVDDDAIWEARKGRPLVFPPGYPE